MLKVGEGLSFLGVHTTDYYGVVITTGTKFITVSIVDNEFITYENMYLPLPITHVIIASETKSIIITKNCPTLKSYILLKN
jgi:hypothetical protein